LVSQPFASESQASFKLDKRQNVWYLHSEGIGGNNTDFMQKYLNASIQEVLKWAEKQNFSSFQPQSAIQKQNNTKPNYQITEIIELQNEHLKNYLLQRGLSEMVFPFVRKYISKWEKKTVCCRFSKSFRRLGTQKFIYKGAVLKRYFNN
jgi:hypothetical protein